MVFVMFVFLAIAFIFTMLVGRIIEKAKVPWIFAAIIFGLILAVFNPFDSVTSTETFSFLANLGMYFLLFIIGFEIDMKTFKKKGSFIIKSTLFIIMLEAVASSMLIHYIFGFDWFISFLISLSFATVGEAILIPILDEFKIVNTKLGQSIIGIGALDDIIEVIALVMVVIIAGSTVHADINIALTITSLFILFAATFGLTRIKSRGERFAFSSIETAFLFVMFILLLFIGIGSYADAMPLAAFLAGMGIRTFMSGARLKQIESEVKTMCYGFFAPIFFVWIGMSIDVSYIISNILLVGLVVVVSGGTKIVASYIIGSGELGKRNSLLMGIGISVRFSTSLIIIKILLDSGIIDKGIYSLIVASSVIFTFIVPFMFSFLISKRK